MNDEEIKKDWEVIEAATPGPWDNRCSNTLDNHAISRFIWSEYGFLARTIGLSPIKDAEFIAEARTRWPEALREVERLQDVLMYISYMSPDEAEMFAAKHAKEVLKEILK